MAFENVMELTNRLLTSTQALAAMAARLRLDELTLAGDPAVRTHLERVVDALGAREDLERLDERERSVVVTFARSYLAQALDLVDDPARGGTWSYEDPTLLQAQGSASAVVARLIGEAGLASSDARVLDVGTGVAGLAIAFCTTLPGATVVGIDPWEPALAIARENVVSAGLEARITLLPTAIEYFNDPDGFDLVWLPSLFIPEPVIDKAIERIFALTRPGGTVVVGAPFARDDDPIAAAVDDLVTVRSGGSVLDPRDLIARLRRVGFADVQEVERTWQAPLRLVAGKHL